MSADGLPVEPRLRLREELVALRSAEHDGHLVLAEFGQTDHRADVEPVLPGQAVDPDQSVGGADDAQHRARPWSLADVPGVSSAPPSASDTAASTAAIRRSRRPPRSAHRGWRRPAAEPSTPRAPRRRLATNSEIRAPACTGGRSGSRTDNPPRGRLHRQRRRFAIPQRTVLAEVGDPYDDETRVEALQARRDRGPTPSGRACPARRFSTRTSAAAISSRATRHRR